MSSPPSELNPLHHSLVRAGAGAGKTRGLVEKVVSVYRHFQKQSGQDSPRIVLTTFTRKATQELKERLILKACTERDPGLLQFVSDPGRLHISTIHGLLNVFLKQVGHLAGLDAGHQIVGADEGHKLARSSFRQLLLEWPEGMRWIETYGFERTLEMLQRYDLAASEFGGELRSASYEELEETAAIEAERWRVWLADLADEISNGVNEPSWQAYAQALQVFASTWDGTPASLEGLPIKPRRSARQAEWSDWHDRTDSAIKEFKKNMDRDCWEPSGWPGMIQAWESFSELGKEFRSRLWHFKNDRADFEMSDLELKSLEILREKPFLGRIFAEEWDFWMIDEYQDTSPIQVEILQALIGDRPRYVVGDPQQSIYLFRGAEVGVFMQAEREVLAIGGEVRELRKNYRSAPDLLLWINDFITELSPAFSAMEPREKPGKAESSRVRMIRAPDAQSELEAVVSRVAELVQSGVALEQICVLGRTHQTLMQVSRALKSFGYPTHVHAARGFSQRREVLDAQALWKFLLNPHDNHNLLVLFRSPWFYVPDGQLADWMAERPPSLWRALSAQAGLNNDSVERLKQAQARLPIVGLTRAFEEALCACGLLDLSLVNDPAGRRESNLWKLVDKAHNLEKEGGLCALDFLSSEAGSDPLDSAEGDATSAQEPGCINLMTIHGSKGLEFEHVVLPRMGDSPRSSSIPVLEADAGRFFFPVWDEEAGEFKAGPLDVLSVRRRQKKELEEFDRWLYVALTRAKQSLTLSWSGRDRESWAARAGWCGKPAGRYEGPGYIYEIVEEWAPPARYETHVSDQSKIRPIWCPAKPRVKERQAVTDLVARQAQTFQGADELRRFEAQALGIRLHKHLEALKYGRHQHVSSQDQAALQFVLNLQEPPMQAVLEQGQTEWGFVIERPKGVLEGQIDLWGKVDGRLYVVDYKSGSPGRLEEAFLQLGVYAWALRQFGHQEPVELAVIYPLVQKVERRAFTDELFDRWELEFGRS